MHICKLNEIIFQVLSDPKTAVVVLDANIKNQVTISIAYIHIHDSLIIKMIHHAINQLNHHYYRFDIYHKENL